ncbi:MAG TPA: hypothetical protein VN631_09320 [Negativicutes bacterium]|nr:hypothetical protein [Negativicutes bacterium]
MLGRCEKKALNIIGSHWGRLLLLVCLMSMMIIPVAWADGMPEDNTNPPGVDNGAGTGGKNPGSPGSGAWPPNGTVPKGNFVAGAFAGTWYAFVDNTAFTLIIEQEDQIIKIAHTAIYDYGRRVDSSVGVVSMVGTVSGAIAYVEWKSGLSPENGRATLEYQPGRPVTLHWKIVDSPKKGEEPADVAVPVEVSYFLPASAFLIRK